MHGIFDLLTIHPNIMSRTNKWGQNEIRAHSVKMDHESKTEFRQKVLTGYYFEEELNDLGSRTR